MKILGYGEDRLIARLTRRLAAGKDVRVGPGDDCAVIGRPRDRLWQLLKTDCLVEGVHFDEDDAMHRVGWKALARNLSDIAAMGGTPRHALITIAISPEATVRSLDAFYSGLRKCADRFGVSIVGGETSRSPGPMFVSVAVKGEVERLSCATRSGGRVGDFLYVTGRLGGSRAGRHLDFIPRLVEARWLTTHFRIRAMMDLSDGLGSDLPRLAAASGCGWEIDEACLPRHRGCTVREALSDGEDYELLFAAAPRDAVKLEAGWSAEFPNLPLTRIGRLTEPRAGVTPKIASGHDHFAQR